MNLVSRSIFVPRFRWKECHVFSGRSLGAKPAAGRVSVFGLRCWILPRTKGHRNKVHCVGSSSKSKIVLFRWHRDCTVHWAGYWISSVNRSFHSKLSRLINIQQQPWEWGENSISNVYLLSRNTQLICPKEKSSQINVACYWFPHITLHPYKPFGCQWNGNESPPHLPPPEFFFLKIGIEEIGLQFFSPILVSTKRWKKNPTDMLVHRQLDCH